MIYFCADDYGISQEYNRCIEACLKKGTLNKVSILPNGSIDDSVNALSKYNSVLALHLNLVEGYPLSQPEEIGLLIDENGCFKDSFIGLLLTSLSPQKSELEKQLYKEITAQIRFWKQKVGDNIIIDSHQHAHMIPLVFKTLMRVIKDEGVHVKYLRIPDEPILPYLLTPSLYPAYKPVGIIKQFLLKFLALVNRKEAAKSNISTAYFMGVMLSGKLNFIRVQKLLKHYSSLAKKHGKNIEVAFHPGYAESDQTLIDGSRKDFKKFYRSPWRNIEFETLMDDALIKMTKEG